MATDSTSSPSRLPGGQGRDWKFQPSNHKVGSPGDQFPFLDAFQSHLINITILLSILRKFRDFWELWTTKDKIYENYVSVIKYLIIPVSQPHMYTIKQIRKTVSSSSPTLNVSILLSGGNAGIPYTIQHRCLRISVTKRMLLSTSVISKGCWWEETYRLRTEWKPIPSTRRQRRETATPPGHACGGTPLFLK